MEGLSLGQVHEARYASADDAKAAAAKLGGSQILVKDGTNIALQDVTFDSPQAFQRFKDASQSGTYVASDLPTNTMSFALQDSVDVPPSTANGIGSCKLVERDIAVTPFSDQVAAVQTLPATTSTADHIKAIRGLIDTAKNDGWIAPAEQKGIQDQIDTLSTKLFALATTDPTKFIAEMGDGLAIKSLQDDLNAHNGTHPVDITAGPGPRAELMMHAPQENDIAGRLSGDICGGAAAVNALIEDSATPAAAATNAKAILDTAKALGVKLSPDQKTAVQHLGAGKMSANDVQHLQVALYKTARSFDNRVPPGISSATMAGLVLALRERGGFQNSNPVFSQTHQTVKGTTNETDHWVVTTQGRTINSWPNDGDNKRSTVTSDVATPRSDASWRTTVSNSPTGVTTQFVMPGKTTALEATMTLGAKPHTKHDVIHTAIRQFTHAAKLP